MAPFESRANIGLSVIGTWLARGGYLEIHAVRWLWLMVLSVSLVIAASLRPALLTDANAAPLCRAPGVPKGCITRPVAGNTSTSSNSYNSLPMGRIIVPAPPGGRPIGHCYECIAPHYAWPPSGGAT